MPKATAPEPRAMTISDLAWLVAGLALASTLGTYHTIGPPAFFAGDRLGARAWALGFVGEALAMGCLALLPAIVARRWRHGGPLGSAEFAGAAIGLGFFFDRLGDQAWVGLIERRPGEVGGGSFPSRELAELWPQATAAVAIVALAGAVMLRRARPAWVAGLLLAFAWGGADYGSTRTIRNFATRDYPTRWYYYDLWYTRCSEVYIVEGSFQIFLYLPLVAGWAGLRHPARPTWIAAASTVVATLSVAATQAGIGLSRYSGRQYEYDIMIAAAVLPAVGIVAAFGPAWGRYFGVGSPPGPRSAPAVPDLIGSAG